MRENQTEDRSARTMMKVYSEDVGGRTSLWSNSKNLAPLTDICG